MQRTRFAFVLAFAAITACGDSSVPGGESVGGAGAAGSIATGAAGGSADSGGMGGMGGAQSAGASGASGVSYQSDAGPEDAGEAVRDATIGMDAASTEAGAAKPRVWISSDLTDPSSPNATDTDDVVTTAAFVLLANRFTVEGIAVGATPFSSCGSSLPWINVNLIPAYQKEVANLNTRIGGYPTTFPFLQASTCQKKFDPATPVDIAALPTVKQMIDAAKAGPLFVLNWGPMDETASAVSHLLAINDTATLDRITVISHWTWPTNQYNCSVDASACSYVHQQASAGKVKLFELGPMGQTGLVDNSCKSSANLNQATMYASAIGNLMKVKWNGSGWPDMSDGATFFVLAGFGGGLGALKSDGTVDSAGFNRLCNDRSKIATVLEAAATAAAGK